MRVLNISVAPDLLRQWVDWFAPPEQPFLVENDLLDSLGQDREDRGLPDELRDTYGIYGAKAALPRIWLHEGEFMAMTRSVRTALVRSQHRLGRELVPSVRSWSATLGESLLHQAAGHRFVWWPSLLAGHEEGVLRTYIEEGRRPSRHDEVQARTWDRARTVLPGAPALAGTYAPGSGPNCFGTVMAAAGVQGAETAWMQREPFESWLAECTRPGGSDDQAGTVLVWRSPDHQVQHAAVSIGEGWMLHKPSQGWMSPIKVLTAAEVKQSARASGRRMHRYSLDRRS